MAKKDTEEDKELKEEEVSKGLLIQGSDFALKAFNETSDLFDLYLLRVINKGKANEKLEYKIDGYAMSLNRAVQKIIQYRIRKRAAVLKGPGDEGLIKYFKLWCEEKHKLLSLFDLTPEEWEHLTSLKRFRPEEVKKPRKKKGEITETVEESENAEE